MTGPIGAALAAAVALLGAPPAGAPAGPPDARTDSLDCRFRASGEELRSRASPPDSASVTLDGKRAKICYSSPRARGREIMGGLVPYGQPWRLGANEPTTLHLTFAADVGGVRVGPGSYSLYAIPGREEWEIVVNGSTRRWGVPIDDEVRAADVGSVTVDPAETDEMVENLTLSFDPAGPRAATLVIEWERTRLEVPVRRAGS